MTNILQNIAGMGGLTDQVIATDFLVTSKSGVRNLAFALTETASKELRDTLRQQLKVAVDTHEVISNYMVSKGFYHPIDLNEQTKINLTTANTALELASKRI